MVYKTLVERIIDRTRVAILGLQKGDAMCELTVVNQLYDANKENVIFSRVAQITISDEEIQNVIDYLVDMRNKPMPSKE